MLNYMYLIMQTESKEKARNTHADIMSHVSQYFGDMFKIIDFCSVTLSIDSIRSVTDFFFVFLAVDQQRISHTGNIDRNNK